MSKRVLASDGLAASAVEALEAKGFEVVKQFYEPAELGTALADFDALVVRSATKVREPIIDQAAAAGRLKLVIRAGVGVDNIDVQYAEEKGIAVRNTPKASSASVAELALGHMFAVARYIGAANQSMPGGEWNKKKYEGVELGGKTLGLIGMGRISRELAKRAHALGMNILYTDILGKANDLPDYEFGTQDDVLAKADFISIHIPKPSDRNHVLGAEEIATMKDGVYLINTARGGLIDHEALLAALDSGKVAGAALDVFPTEPIPAGQDAVVQHPAVSVTPHIGGSTREAQDRIGEEVVSIIVEFFDAK